MLKTIINNSTTTMNFNNNTTATVGVDGVAQKLQFEDDSEPLRQQQQLLSAPLAAPFPKNEILPRCHKDAMIFIPTKGRAYLSQATWMLLLGGNEFHYDEEKAIPFTLVVEPQDEEDYSDTFAKYLDKGACHLAVLPKNDQGVSYARNYILHELAPKPEEASAQGKTSWFWIMDDDIQQFLIAVGEGKLALFEPHKCFEEIYRRVAQVLAHEGGDALPVPVATFGLEYMQFALGSAPRHLMCNSYANIAVMMNLSRMPEGIRYRFRVREDYDFALQLIRSGRTNLRFHDIAFKAPQMNKQNGGMTVYYNEQKSKDIRIQNKLFLEAWGDAEVRKRYLSSDSRITFLNGDGNNNKHNNGSEDGAPTTQVASVSNNNKNSNNNVDPIVEFLRREPDVRALFRPDSAIFCQEMIKGPPDNQRFDMKVQWLKLSDMLNAVKFLRLLPGAPRSGDPLAPMYELARTCPALGSRGGGGGGTMPSGRVIEYTNNTNNNNQNGKRAKDSLKEQRRRKSQTLDEIAKASGSKNEDSDDDEEDDEDETAEQQKQSNNNNKNETQKTVLALEDQDDDAEEEEEVTLPKRRGRQPNPKPKPQAKKISSKAKLAANNNNKIQLEQDSSILEFVPDNNDNNNNNNKNNDKKQKVTSPDAKVPAPKVKAKPGWGGYTIQRYRQAGPELETQCDLKHLQFNSVREAKGQRVCFIHSDISKPAFWTASVLECRKSTKTVNGEKINVFSFQVVPDDNKDPRTRQVVKEGLIWVDAVYEIPEDEKSANSKIDDFYRSSSRSLDLDGEYQ